MVVILSKRHFIFLFVFFSFLLHAGFMLWCSFYIEARPSPTVNVWTNIIAKKDLFFKKKPIQFPPESFSSSNSLRREYFSSGPLRGGYSFKSRKQPADILPYIPEVSFNKASKFTNKDDYIYLWEREAVWSSWEEEAIPYKAYVSKRGKIVFLYPEKLSVNSYESLNFQDYVRDSTLFFGDKFFWTKLEAVVK